MRNCFRGVLSIVITVLVLTAGVIPARADIAEPPVVGDVDRDFRITILDANRIQKYLANIETPDLPALALADADDDGMMSVLDATAIQKHLASLPSDYRERILDDFYFGDVWFHSDSEIMTDGYLSGRETCYVGVPVTFSVKERRGAQPRRYFLIIDGETVARTPTEVSDEHTFVHTFSREGAYTVTVRVENRYGMYTEYTGEYSVLSLPDNGIPVIVGATFYDASRMQSGNGVLTVHAENGTAPYEYRYEIYRADQSGNEIKPIDDKGRYDTGFIAENKLDLKSLREVLDAYSFAEIPAMTKVEITVRDAQGAVSLPVTVSYICFEVLA